MPPKATKKGPKAKPGPKDPAKDGAKGGQKGAKGPEQVKGKKDVEGKGAGEVREPIGPYAWWRNFWDWLLTDEPTYKQITAMAILLFILVNILYYCIRICGKRIRKWKMTKQACRRIKMAYKSACTSLKAWTCPIEIRLRRKEDNFHHIVFLPSESLCIPVNSKNMCDVNLCNNDAFKLLSTCLNGAERSINLCLFVLTCKEITDLLLEAIQRGITVRLITDKEISSKARSEIERLREAGAQICMKSSPYLMHHKFAIVDERILICGSLNWTKQGLCGNHEHLLITNERRIVQPFYKEFQKLRHSASLLSAQSFSGNQPLLPTYSLDYGYASDRLLDF